MLQVPASPVSETLLVRLTLRLHDNPCTNPLEQTICETKGADLKVSKL